MPTHHGALLLGPQSAPTHVRSGGIAPEPLARLRRNARFTKTKGARDSTNYGLARVSPHSYLTHHTQRISAAAVRADAKNARVQIACLKQSVCAAA